jgi:hypothetical protein
LTPPLSASSRPEESRYTDDDGGLFGGESVAQAPKKRKDDKQSILYGVLNKAYRDAGSVF